MSARVMLRPRAKGRSRSNVGTLGALIIAAGLAFRVWALARSWFYFDDLAFLSAGTNDPLTWHFVGRVYAGHVMPAGWLVIKALATWAPFRWSVWAGVLVAMQAVASWGMLRLLRSMFGEGRAVLALLALYVFYVFTLPAGLWFAAGINQLPMQIALVFGVHAHVEYLRHRRRRDMVAALLWTVFGLAFYEKTIILFGLYAILALGWFVQGSFGDRVSQVWRQYRSGVIAYGVLAITYLVIYSQVGLNVTSSQASGSLMSDVAYRLVGVAFSTAAIGGPFEWRAMSANALADPSDLISLGSWVALGSLVWYGISTRTKSRRAWSLILFTLAANVYLLATARANLVGPDIGLEYRYQTESAAVLVMSAGLALLPLVGAPEVNSVREGADRSHEREGTIRTIVLLVVAGCLISSLAYVQNWTANNPTKPFFTRASRSMAATPGQPLPLVDLSLPQNLLWAFGYPENTDSHVFRSLDYPVTYPDVSIDRLYALKDSGDLVPAIVLPARVMVPGEGCGYVLRRSTPTSIPLNGPVIGGGWWIRMEYGAPRPFTATISSGETRHRIRFPAGDHTAYFRADGNYESVLIDNDAAGRGACVTNLVLGNAVAQAPGS